MEHYKAGDRIGAEHSELYCRKDNVISSLQKNPFTGKTCIRAELSRNATAEISKSLDLSIAEIKNVFETHGIHSNLGDRLVADAITVYVEQRRPFKFTKDEGVTHMHGGRFASTVKPTFGEIKYAQEHIRNAEVKRLDSQKKIDQK